MSLINNNSNIHTVLVNIINDLLESSYENIAENEILSEIGLHSLLTYKLITEIETEFKIIFGFEDLVITNFKTIKDIRDIIYKYQ